jgi:hypothetical protein
VLFWVRFVDSVIILSYSLNLNYTEYWGRNKKLWRCSEWILRCFPQSLWLYHHNSEFKHLYISNNNSNNIIQILIYSGNSRRKAIIYRLTASLPCLHFSQKHSSTYNKHSPRAITRNGSYPPL